MSQLWIIFQMLCTTENTLKEVEFSPLLFGFGYLFKSINIFV